MKVFLHHIYEYTKGLRNLVLYTGLANDLKEMEAKLKKKGIDYYVCPVGKSRVNIFFGHAACVDTVRKIGCENLSRLSPEHDYMLGIMLGYDRTKQCVRFLERISPAENNRDRLRLSA